LVSFTREYVVDTEEEIELAGAGDAPLGLFEVSRVAGNYQNHPTKLLVRVGYEGITNEPDPEADAVYEFDVLLEENPIEAHPKIQDIIKKYAGEVDPSTKRVRFPLTLPNQNTSGAGALAGGGGQGATKRNPLFGLTSYLTLGSVFRRSTVSRTMPSDLLGRVGETRQSLPRGFPTPEGRLWLIMPPRAVLRGNIFEISDEWKLIRSDDEGIKVVNSMLHS
jgi:hypothetical protein